MWDISLTKLCTVYIRNVSFRSKQAKPKGESTTTTVTTAAAPLHPAIPEEPSGDQPETEEVEDKDSNSKPVKTPKPVPVLEPDVPDPMETPEVEINLLNSLTGEN